MEIDNLREEFEKVPYVKEILGDLHPTIIWFGEDKYYTSFSGFDKAVLRLNGAWAMWCHQHPELSNLRNRIRDLELTQNKLELKAEEAEAVSICLDEQGIAKVDENGKEYSLWGRCHQLRNKSDITEDELEQLYWEFDADRNKLGDERIRFKGVLRKALSQSK